MIVNIDFETYSECNIRQEGSWRYAAHPSTEVICCAYRVDYGDVELWTPDMRVPEFFTVSDVTLKAWNASFEYAIVRDILRLDPGSWERWACTKARAMATGLPASLAAAVPAARLDDGYQKDRRGTFLINKLCQPIKNTGERLYDPKLLQELYDYCIQDVIAESMLDQQLPDLSESERQLWILDQTINARGIPVDINAIEQAVIQCDAIAASHSDQLKTLTTVDNPRSTQQMKAWLMEQGVEVESLSESAVSELMKIDLPEHVKDVLMVYQQSKRTVVKKYTAFQKRACSDNRLRGLLQYCGASTGRWSSTGINIQNLPRPSIDDPDAAIDCFSDLTAHAESIGCDRTSVLASCIRGMVKAPEGSQLIVADFASIEARVLAWLAGQQSVINVFNGDGRLYEAQAALIFNKAIDDVDKQERFLGKIAVLALGFAGGKYAFQSMARNYGVTDISDEIAQGIVDSYRRANKHIVKFWSLVERAALEAIRNPGTDVNVNSFITYRCTERTLECHLPSGRAIHYWYPRLVLGRYGHCVVGYENKQKTAKNRVCAEASRMVLVENIVQAVAADLLRHSLINLEAAGYPVVFHVHDEIVCESASGRVDEMVAIMTQVPEWLPGFPLAAEGYAAQRYTK